MATHKRPEYRDIVRQMLSGERKKNRFTRPVQVGDTIVFYSATPLPSGLDGTERDPEPNPLIAVVTVSQVEEGPNKVFPHFVHWEAVEEGRPDMLG